MVTRTSKADSKLSSLVVRSTMSSAYMSKGAIQVIYVQLLFQSTAIYKRPLTLTGRPPTNDEHANFKA